MGGGAELCNLNLLMKTLKRARIETSTEKSLVCVSVVNVVNEPYFSNWPDYFVRNHSGRPMAELVLLCTV